MPGRLTERLVATFLFGLALFNPPLLTVFSRPVMVLGIPLLYLYLFVVWLGLIVALALTIERGGGDDTRPGG